MFLSIIIPTWRNTEAELRRCLSSLYVSSLPFEVLLVDDGNEAAYGEMLDRMAEEREHLTVLHAPHAGVSAARNLGVLRARGDYVLFVDADDVVTRQFWKDAEEIRRKGIPFDIIYGMVSMKEEAPLSMEVREDFCGEPLDENVRHALYGHMFALGRGQYRTKEKHLGRGPWARLIRRDFLRRFPFDTSLALGEDMMWNLDMLRAAPKGRVTEHVCYYVIGNPNSATRGYHKESIERHRAMLCALKGYVTPETVGDYHSRIFESLAEIGHKYFLSPQNHLSWFQKVKEFNQVAMSEPFCEVLKSDVKIGGVKPALKLALYRAGLLLYAYKLKMLLGR